MKALGRNPADIFVFALVSMGGLSLGGFDLVSEPFGSMMVLSRTAVSVAALGILHRWIVQKSLRRGLIRVRT